ncbi:hypothetical protein [Tolypothrix sp. VBCCA 56010]|uniref:hypothetical protein n=1 Tax=Tolypothrix sp. VBCCA 56010 TaxID=3137731 RepID=UPI003D7DDB88
MGFEKRLSAIAPLPRQAIATSNTFKYPNMQILAASLILAIVVPPPSEPEPQHRGGGRRLQVPQTIIIYTTTQGFNYV